MVNVGDERPYLGDFGTTWGMYVFFVGGPRQVKAGWWVQVSFGLLSLGLGLSITEICLERKCRSNLFNILNFLTMGLWLWWPQRNMFILAAVGGSIWGGITDDHHPENMWENCSTNAVPYVHGKGKTWFFVDFCVYMSIPVVLVGMFSPDRSQFWTILYWSSRYASTTY